MMARLMLLLLLQLSIIKLPTTAFAKATTIQPVIHCAGALVLVPKFGKLQILGTLASFLTICRV
jgi:hypothetical protein